MTNGNQNDKLCGGPGCNRYFLLEWESLCEYMVNDGQVYFVSVPVSLAERLLSLL